VAIERTAVQRPTPAWDDRRAVFLPSNLGINVFQVNQHGGADPNHWLTTPYDVNKVEADLSLLASLGIRILRVWAPVECVIAISGSAAPRANAFARNLDDFLARCRTYGMSCVLVMGDGHATRRPIPPHDGKFLWEMIQSRDGRRRYADASVAYVNRFGPSGRVYCWEIANEPYGNLTWASYPQALGITKDDVHAYLQTSYEAIKRVVSDPVGFSELEEEEQHKYRVFSDAQVRETYIDDCTDYYSMHIYRARAAQMGDFRGLTTKPKYLSEVGHYNYKDVTGEYHAGQPANLELLAERENMQAVIDLCTKAVNSGFALVMPWDLSVNPGMFVHHPDGAHTIKALPRWMQSVLLAAHRESATSRQDLSGA
jgi:hypothetical protein